MPGFISACCNSTESHRNIYLVEMFPCNVLVLNNCTVRLYTTDVASDVASRCYCNTVDNYTVSQKNAPTLKRYSSELEIDFDDFGQKYSKVSRIESACFSFYVGLLFFINFSSFKLDAEK